MKTKEKEYSIYPTCLSCYNAGYLVGYWFKYDENTNKKDLENAMSIEQIHKNHNIEKDLFCDEVFISDYENLKVDEYDSPTEIIEYLEVIKVLGFSLGMYYLENKNDYTIESLESAYCVDYGQYKEFIYDSFKDTYDEANNGYSVIEAISHFLDDDRVERWFKEAHEVIEIKGNYYIIYQY